MSQLIPELGHKGLRQFALIFAVIVVLVFGIVIPLLAGYGFLWLPWAIGGVFAIWGVTAPLTIRPFYQLWMRFGLVMNAVITRVVLAFVFYLLLLPFGLVFKLRGVDPLKRRREPELSSYRRNSDDPHPKHMEKPF